MIGFILGFIVGGVIAVAVMYVYLSGRVEATRQELGFLQARLRTLVRLAEAGLLRPDSIEAANVLTQLHDLVATEAPIVPRRQRETTPTDVEAGTEDIPPIFRR